MQGHGKRDLPTSTPHTDGIIAFKLVVVQWSGFNLQWCHLQQRFGLYGKGIQCVDDVGDNEQGNFITWEDAQDKFKLTNSDFGDWAMLTDKISSKWQQLLDEDTDDTHPR